MNILLRLLLMLVLYSNATFAQNLVSNPSFETLRNLPVKENPKNVFEYEPQSGFIPYQKNLVSWFAASQTTPDLRIHSSTRYNECKRKFKNCDKAHSGANCVGIITSMTNSKVKSYREYIQIKLDKRIRPNEKVFVEFWITKERQAKLVSNNIGCYFSMKSIKKGTKEVLDLEPQINIDTIINEDKKKWVKISGSFIPDKPYKYFLLGNFYENDKTNTIRFKNYNGSPYTPPYAYYLIDDVKVWQDVKKEEEKEIVFENRVVEKNTAIQLKNIEFEFDKSILKDSSIIELNNLISFLKEYPSLKIKIQGHTDSYGEDEYNQILSENRAKAVYSYLVAKGIKQSRLSTEGFGENKPLNSNITLRDRNRRVEFIIIDEDKI